MSETHMGISAPSRRLAVDSPRIRGIGSWLLRALRSPVLVLVLLSSFAIAPLFHPMYFWGAHDARHSVYFLVEFDRSIADGILYPRWSPDFTFGYGYPIFNIYAPLAFYLGEAFHLLGLGFVESVKAVFGLSLVLSGLSMYRLARDFFGPWGALLAGLVYTYMPYRIVDVYVRGALAESLSFVLLPLVFWAFRHVAIERDVKNVVIGSLCLAGLILTSNVMAMLFVPLLAVYCIWTAIAGASGSVRRLAETCGWMLGAGTLGLALSAIFWLPMAAEYQYVRTDQWTTADYDYRGHFVYLYQLLSPFWGYGISKPGPGDEMPFQLGVVPVILAVLGLWMGRARRGQGDPATALQAMGSQSLWYFHSTLFFVLTALGAVLLMLSISSGIWEVLRLAVFVQFPWRLLAVTALSLSFLAGSVARGDRQSHGSFAALAAIVVAVLLGSYSYLSPQFIEPAEGPVSLGGLMRFQQSSGELVGLTKWNQEKPKDSPLMPLYLAGQPVTSKVVPESVPPGAVVETIRRSTIMDEVRVKSSQDMTLTFYTQAYPGWKAYVDGAPEAIEPVGKFGLISTKVPAGEHTVLLKFETTTPRVLGSLITGLSFVFILVWIAWSIVPRKAGR